MLVHSGIAPIRPALPLGTVPHAPPRRASALGTWFEAPCAWGAVRLCADPAGETAPHAAQAALLLARAEPLLAALDDWIGVDLAWRWAAAPALAAPGAQASVGWRGADIGCTLVAPWPLLRALPVPDEALAARLDWPLVPALLSLGTLALDLDELAALEPGGAVLLPGSMDSPWLGTLRAAGEPDAGVPVDLANPMRPRLAGRDPAVAVEPADPQRIACDLRLDLPLGVSGLRLAGWRREGDAGELVHLSSAGLRATLWRCASALHAEHAVASGSLMPWGDGWALAVESLPDTLEGGTAPKV